MHLISKEKTESQTSCVIQLEDDEMYSMPKMLNACSHISIPRHNFTIENIPEHKGRYNVSIQTGGSSETDEFAKLVTEYGKA